MLNEIERLLKGQPSESMMGLVTGGDLYNYDRSDPKIASEHLMLCHDYSPKKLLSQQLIDDLAKLRDNTTIVGRDPAEEARYRLKRPFFEPNFLLPWPPVHSPPPLKYDFYADRYSEESSSPSLSTTSEPSNSLENWDECVSVADAQALLRSPTHHRVYSDSLSHLNHGSSVFKPKAPSPAPRIIPHIIGEDDPFNPFSNDLVFEDKNARSIDTPEGKIFAPVPKLSTAAALANFEAIALAATMPAVEGVVEKELFPSKNYADSSYDWISRSMYSSKEVAAPSKENLPASATPFQQPNAGHRDVLYQTGPKPQVQLVNDMIALLSLKPGPLKDEKMKQLWKSNGQGTSGNSSDKTAPEMTGNEVYESLIPVPPQPPTSHPTNRQQLSFASSSRMIDRYVSRDQRRWKKLE
ncbi:hypothetical protein H2248_004211 [Termitomyces sp. 'cryptogamus']|nr:hypothetical protein H2248_004211 [Termitomyces sp. 'cryptogamus']